MVFFHEQQPQVKSDKGTTDSYPRISLRIANSEFVNISCKTISGRPNERSRRHL
jgi:hypothetical protein